jgi:hypothetical protein
MELTEKQQFEAWHANLLATDNRAYQEDVIREYIADLNTVYPESLKYEFDPTYPHGNKTKTAILDNDGYVDDWATSPKLLLKSIGKRCLFEMWKNDAARVIKLRACVQGEDAWFRDLLQEAAVAIAEEELVGFQKEYAELEARVLGRTD